MTKTKSAQSVAEFHENKKLIASEILEIVRTKCTKDSGGYLMTHPAQDHIEDVLNRLPKNDRPSALVSLGEVLFSLTTGEIHEQPRCFGALVAAFPDNNDTSVKTRHALDKSGKKNGLTVPPGWERNL